MLLVEVPPELILHTVSLLTREAIVDPGDRLVERISRGPELVPDLPSINALCQTNTVFHCTLNPILYGFCASVERLGKLALLFAVEHELESTFDKLVAAGVGPNDLYFDFGTCSLLHIAAGLGHRAMVVKLLGIEDIMATVHSRESTDLTALDYAARDGHLEIVKLLAPIPIPMPSSDVPPDSDDFELETQERYLSIALMESLGDGNLEVVQYLISEGASPNFLDENFYTGTALYRAASTANLALVQLLLASGADPNIHALYKFPPLFNASTVDVRQALVEAGADINAKDEQSRNILAYRTGDVELLRFALERGVDPNNVDDFGRTPLHYACCVADIYAGAPVEILLQFGATTVEKAGDERKTPVDLAMDRGKSEVVNMLEPLVRDPGLKARIATWWKEMELDGEIIH
ncbi:ankyrin repeat-containing domain protein [Mycena galopus ATCC 62051]|nr:ankyrin repeat-containing domain protein [Mycena galopus ATCC 62051]